MKHITYILLVIITIACSHSTQSVKGTKWQGIGQNKDIQLILNESNGYLIKAYSSSEADTFRVSFKQENDMVIINRSDDIVSAEQQLVLDGDKLESENISFSKIKE